MNSTNSGDEEIVLDVRIINPATRHQTINRVFSALTGRQTLQLVVDHNPLRLKRLMEFTFDDVAWTYLEEGPQVWRVRLGHEAAG